MERSGAAKVIAQDNPKIWREIRARLCAMRSGPQWLKPGDRRNQRRLCRLLIDEVLRDQRTTAQNG
jgi:hypothetical protein